MTECINISSLDNGDHEAAAGVTLKSVVNQVFLPIVCVFGVVGNVLNLAILTRRKLQKSFRTLEQAANLCLVALALSDLMFCFCAFLTVFLPPNNIYHGSGFWLIYSKFSVAVINIFIMESTLLTVAMSLERYLAICFPLRQDIYLTTSRIKLIIFFTFIFSASFNIPVFWRYEIIPVCSEITSYPALDSRQTLKDMVPLTHSLNSHSQTVMGAIFATSNSIQESENSTKNSATVLGMSLIHNKISTLHTETHAFSQTTQPSSNWTIPPHVSTQVSLYLSTLPTKIEDFTRKTQTEYTVRIVLLFGSHVYDTAYRIIWAFVGNFIPLILLFFFNVCLCRQIFGSYRNRKQLGRQNRPRSSSHVLTVTLVAIVVLFFILVAPSEVTLQISHMTSSGDTPLYTNIEAVLNLMQAFNFSVNFILYCTISPHFRKTLKYMMCGWCQYSHRTRDSTIKFKTSSM